MLNSGLAPESDLLERYSTSHGVNIHFCSGRRLTSPQNSRGRGAVLPVPGRAAWLSRLASLSQVCLLELLDGTGWGLRKRVSCWKRPHTWPSVPQTRRRVALVTISRRERERKPRAVSYWRFALGNIQVVTLGAGNVPQSAGFSPPPLLDQIWSSAPSPVFCLPPLAGGATGPAEAAPLDAEVWRRVDCIPNVTVFPPAPKALSP